MAKLSKAEDRALRNWTKVLDLWRLCGKTSCRRARACRGNVGDCAPRNFALAPEGVRAWFWWLMHCRDEGLTFDDAMARLDLSPADEAYRRWKGGAETSFAGR